MAVAAKDIAQILSAEAQNRLDEIASGLDQQQLLWASGYLAGRAALGGELNLATSAAVAPALAAAPAARVAVLYASETGNSRRIAEEFAAHLQASGLPVHLSDLSEYKPRQLAKEKQAVIVAATHGLGDAPEGTEAFFEYWFSDKAPQLADLSYSVLALGDSSYDDFCQIGVEIDERFAALGATRVHPRVDCDVDFEVDAQGWRDGVFEKLERTEPAASRAPVPYIHAVSDTGFSRARPFDAELLVDQRITGRDSSKDVRHIELLLEDSGLDYLPGDSFGVWPTNPTVLVDQLISATGLDEQATVNVGDAAISLRDALSSKREITATSRGFLQ
ncbi:MAG: sulfite reductase [NADPH] flavoprotein alpha-component, partial [Gammaproteobacteria bacterium]|nr:sulfite reductase [NADPH] flavoprotein alpha-component [Gammaproteobacteria bacterium]